MTKAQKKSLLRIISSIILFAVALFIEHSEILTGIWLLAMFIPIYLFIGWDVLLEAIKGIFRGQVFDENFLMSIATIGAFFIQQYPEAVAVMIFYQLGEWFQGYAVGKSRQSITELMNIKPDYANVEKDGQLHKVSPESIEIGDEIVVVAGEKIPLDGTIILGSASVDTSALTGESTPRTLREGDDAMSGCINMNGMLKIKVTRPFSESTVSKILELVENASSRKSKAENFITKFAKYYTPVVVFAALFLAVLPPLLIKGETFGKWVPIALNFLVVSCPCALVISVPLSFFGGIGGASKQGILVKGSNYLEVLAETKTMVFDKTGTLTKGVFRVIETAPAEGISPEELVRVTALAESFSQHPISISLKDAYGAPLDNTVVKEFKDIAGHGISALVEGRQIYAGNQRLMEKIGVDFLEPSQIGTTVHVAEDKRYLGHIIIADQLKDDAQSAIAGLKAKGIKTVMLTGDSKEVGEDVGKKLGLDQVYSQLLPWDKVDKLEAIMAENKSPKARVAFVGDGINDAPVLSRSDVGISMGGLGSDAAIEASDIVLMDDKPSKILTAITVARKTLRIVKQNVIFALGVKAIVLVLSVFSKATMWQAVFADVGVSVIAVLNAMRALKVDKNKQ